jgi:transcriptional regulator with GAF, ATPase, and Fis domain
MRVGGIKEHVVDLRVVAATNRDLEAEVRAGRFRQDLYFRLGGAKVSLPPLRDRPREIALLAAEFLEQARRDNDRPPMSISAGAMDALTSYAWPGNVRELKNEMRFVAATADGDTLEPWHLSERLAGAGTAESGDAAEPPEREPAARFRPIAEELRDIERRRMIEALSAAGGVQKRAAELIAMPLRTFRMKSKQYGIELRGGR